MSAHSCNELCELHDRFHEIQKYEGEHEAWYASKEDMRDFLVKKMVEFVELLSLLK